MADHADHTVVQIRLSPRAVRRRLLAIVAGLTVASAAAQVLKFPLDAPSGHGIVPLLDSDAEANLPTMYSSLTLLACSLMAGAIALSAVRARGRHARHWLGLAIVFLLAAVDETAGTHEIVNSLLSWALDPGGLLFAIWVVPGTLVVVALAVAYRPFVAALPGPVRRLAARGALVFVVGALGLEIIEGAIADAHGGDESFADGLVSVVQEFLEMLGVILLIEALMTYMAIERHAVSISFGETSRREWRPRAS
jgi:hypothetical protein